MKNYIFLVICFSLFLVISCSREKKIIISDRVYVSENTGPYLSIEEYNNIHPGHQMKIDNFAELVKLPGIAVDKEIQQEKLNIAFLYPGEQVSDYWERSLRSFKLRLNEIGIDYSITEIFTRAGVLDIKKQETEIRNLLNHDFDYIVFTLNVLQHEKMIEQILIQGTPKLILQNITTPLYRWEGKQPFLYVGFDHNQGTKMIADYFIQKNERGATYSLLYHTEGYVSEMRGDYFIDYIEDKSDFILNSAYYTDGKIEKAKQSTERILNSSDSPRFIYSCSTDISIGIIEALTERKDETETWPQINGWGGGSKELELLADKKLSVTVMRMNDDNGVAMAEAIRMDIEGKSDRIPLIFSGEMVLIDSETNADEIEEYKKRAFRYSNIEE